MARGRSPSPRTLNNTNGSDAEMRSVSPEMRHENDYKVVIVSNLTRNVAEAHLRTIFSFYGDIKKVDIPLFAKCEKSITQPSRALLFIIYIILAGQNRGKAALEFYEVSAAKKAVSHMNKGYLDGAVLTVELSDAIIRERSRSRSRRPIKNGRVAGRPSASRSLSPRRRAPPSYRDKGRERYRRYSPPMYAKRDIRGSYRHRSNSRSRSPARRGRRHLRRSPSYEKGGIDHRSRRSRSRSPYSLTSSRSRSRSRSYDSRSRSRSYSYASKSSRSRTRSLRSSKSRDRDDIRDSRSRSRSLP